MIAARNTAARHSASPTTHTQTAADRTGSTVTEAAGFVTASATLAALLFRPLVVGVESALRKRALKSVSSPAAAATRTDARCRRQLAARWPACAGG